MAIAFDAESHPGSYAQNNSWSHTVGSAEGRIALVMTATHSGNAAPSTVTFGGVAMTQLADYSGNYRRVCVYYLLNPSSGSNTVVVNWGSALYYGCGVTCLTYSGVHQTDTFRTYSGQTGSTSPVNKTISSADGDLVIDAISEWGDGLACDAGQTQRYLVNNSSLISMGASEEAGASSVTTTWTKSGTGDANNAIYSFSIKPAEPDISEDIEIDDDVDAWKDPDGISSTVGIDDAVTAGFDLQAPVSENLTVDDVVDATREFNRSVPDNMTVDDDVDAYGIFQKAVSDNVGIADAVDTQTIYKPSVPENITLDDIVDAILNNPLRRKQIPLKLIGKHITLRFRNNEATKNLSLVDIGLKMAKSMGMTRSNAEQIRLKGGHIKLRFRNNTLDEELKLDYMSAKIEGYMAQ